ncbi:MAG: hypothetical protein JXP34_01245 [Planctomycetes bacterium]|nr:hypothetical protein [Planctomycetota bacterium]
MANEIRTSWIRRALWIAVALSCGCQSIPPNVRRTGPDSYEPEPGYRWADPVAKERLGVVWAPGEPHPSFAHLVAGPDDRTWVPGPGYAWVSEEKGDRAVVWTPGLPHPARPNVVASRQEGTFEPSPGYEWIETGAPEDLRVRWGPGSAHPECERLRASEKPDIWSLAGGDGSVAELSGKALQAFLLREDLGASFDRARALTESADRFLLLEDGSGVRPEKADSAAAIYRRSDQIIVDVLKRRASFYAAFPVWFVSLELLRARNARGLAMAALAWKAGMESAEHRRRTIEIGESGRASLRSPRVEMPADMMEKCLEIDRTFAVLIEEARRYLVVHYAAIGEKERAHAEIRKLFDEATDGESKARFERVLRELLEGPR